MRTKTNEKSVFSRLGIIAILGVVVMFSVTSCNPDEPIEPTYPVDVQLIYPEGFSTREGVVVRLESTITNAVFSAETDASGLARLNMIAGVYTVSASDSYSVSGTQWILNGNRTGIIITADWINEEPIEVTLTEAKLSQVVIKEYYFNGCQQDQSGTWQRDPYVILYNNSDAPASLENVAFGATLPPNSNSTNNDYSGGVLSYAAENWVPAGYGVFYFANPVTLQPGEQAVVAINQAVNHTNTHSNSINLANPNYYVFYDIESGFTHASYHIAPDISIPESHYLKGIRYPGVSSTAFTMSITSPAFFVFATEGISVVDYAADASNLILHGTSASQVRLKVPTDWVLDGIEVFVQGNSNNLKRLLPAVDNGYIEFPGGSLGYTLYRNVNKTATEAIASNAGKLVYNYAGSVNGTEDPSGIDAEASIRNGARIIYQDTNNAGADFHIRGKQSLRN